jgi:hypothetical protein
MGQTPEGTAAWQWAREMIRRFGGKPIQLGEMRMSQYGKSCPCGAYEASDVVLCGVQPNGTVTVKRGGVYHVCPPPMPREVAELLGKLSPLLEEWQGCGNVQSGTTIGEDYEESFRELNAAIAAVKARYAEGT